MREGREIVAAASRAMRLGTDVTNKIACVVFHGTLPGAVRVLVGTTGMSVVGKPLYCPDTGSQVACAFLSSSLVVEIVPTTRPPARASCSVFSVLMPQTLKAMLDRIGATPSLYAVIKHRAGLSSEAPPTPLVAGTTDFGDAPRFAEVRQVLI